MVKKITWKCIECGNEDIYPGHDDVTLESLQNNKNGNNVMCKACGGPCAAVDVEEISANE